MSRIAELLCLVELAIGLLAWGLAQQSVRVLQRRGPYEHAGRLPQVVIAATGMLPGLERLRGALADQDVGIERLTFAVESRDDPAFARIGEVFAGFEPAVEIVVGDLAVGGGQKSRNLVEALLHHDRAAPLVFADADILPQPGWLATLLRPIGRGRAEISTGYRWPVPLDAHLPTLLVSWIDRSVAALPKPDGGRLIWGGSVALAPGACDRIGLADCLEAAISDDLLIAERARAHGLRVTFPTAALLASPTSHGWGSMFRFGCRQYQMIRLYAPSSYLAALAMTFLNLAGTVAPLVLLAITWRAAIPYGLMVGLSMLATHTRTRLATAAGIVPQTTRGEERLYLLALVLPIVHLAHLCFILGAAHVRTVRWGRCTYRMAGRKVVAIERAEGWGVTQAIGSSAA